MSNKFTWNFFTSLVTQSRNYDYVPGLVYFLDKSHYALVKEIWQELESDCGLKGINITPLPHFSWEIEIDNITLTHQPGGTTKQAQYQFKLGEKE